MRPAQPGFQMHFVDRHRRFQQVGFRRAPPSTRRRCHWYLRVSQTTRRRFRRQSRSRTRTGRPSAAGSRRSASGRCTCRTRPRPGPGMKISQTPPLRRRMGWRRVSQSLKSPASGHALGIRRPHGEAHAGHAFATRPGARRACARPRRACLRCAGTDRNRRSAGRSGRDRRTRPRGRPTGARRMR